MPDLTSAEARERLRLAYADPPYLGCCRLYGHRHDEPWGCWDDLRTHVALAEHLTSFDGWALSASAPSLRVLWPLVPEARVGVWTKTFAVFKRNVRIAYAWEPVLFVPGRDSSRDGAPVGRDYLSAPITLQRGLTGAKPERFCRWVLDLLGYADGDELVDIFPGTGVMGRVAAQGVLLLTDPEEEPRD